MTLTKFEELIGVVNDDGVFLAPSWRERQYELWSLEVESFPDDKAYARAFGKWKASKMPKFIMRFKKHHTFGYKWFFVGIMDESHYKNVCKKYNFKEIEK